MNRRHFFHHREPRRRAPGCLSDLPFHHDPGPNQFPPGQTRWPAQKLSSFPTHLLGYQPRITTQLPHERLEERDIDVGPPSENPHGGKARRNRASKYLIVPQDIVLHELLEERESEWAR